MRIALSLLLIMLLGCPSIPFVQEGEANALDEFNKAEELFGQQKYEEAVPLYEDAIRVRYLLIGAYKHLAICYEKLWKDNDAINTLERSLRVDNKDEETLNNLIRLYNKVGKLEEAKKTKEWLIYVKSKSVGG